MLFADVLGYFIVGIFFSCLIAYFLLGEEAGEDHVGCALVLGFCVIFPILLGLWELFN